MRNRLRYSLLLTVFCFFGSRLIADTIPALSATSASALAPGCPAIANNCYASLSAVGDSFSLSGQGLGGIVNFGTPFFLQPYTTSFSASDTMPSGLSPEYLGGYFEGTFVYFIGTASVNAAEFILTCPSPSTTFGCSNSPIVTVSLQDGTIIAPSITPSSPSTTFVLPASIAGGFNACTALFPAECLTSSPPIIGSVSIDLSGELTVDIRTQWDGGFLNHLDVSESFTSTPEPATMSLFLAGLTAAILWAAKASAKTD